MHKIKILSTKKIEKSERIKLSEKYFYWMEKDFIRVELLHFDIKNIYENNILIFTSKNAVFSVLQNNNVDFLKKKPCICVGEKTKELLEQNKFLVLDFTHYAEDLTQVIAQKHSQKSFVFFCGNLRKNTLPDFFKANSIAFLEIQVYKTKFSPIKINEKFDVILFFSPSGVESYLQNNAISDEICFCIGTTTSNVLSLYSNTIIVPEKPTIERLIDKVGDYFRLRKLYMKNFVPFTQTE